VNLAKTPVERLVFYRNMARGFQGLEMAAATTCDRDRLSLVQRQNLNKHEGMAFRSKNHAFIMCSC